MTDEKRSAALAWMFVAGVVAALMITLFWMTGCDKDQRRIIQQLAPVVDKPPVECGKGQCRHGMECVPCKDGD